ncbi:hypothetical protein N9Z41_02675 [bacterium]|nr:hypothetical protein [bacterium]
MNVQEVMSNVLNTTAAVEIMNELVLATLVSSRETLIAERDRLDNIRVNRDLKQHEEQDWASLVYDIHALNRVIEYYGG